jgi:hypothetical protein
MQAEAETEREMDKITKHRIIGRGVISCLSPIRVCVCRH